MRILSALLLSVSIFLLSACGNGLCIGSPDCTGSLSTSLDFGAVTFNSSKETTFTVRNTGTGDISQMSVSGVTSPFAYKGGAYPGTGGTCSTSLAVGASCTLVLTFAAPAPPAITYTAPLQVSYFSGTATGIASVQLKATSDNGSFNVARGFGDQITALASLSAGLFAMGNFESYSSIPVRGLARMNPSTGEIDTTFNQGTGFPTAGTAVTVQDAGDGTGDIYAAGNFTSYNGTSATRMVRLRSNGSINTAFNSGTLFNDLVSAVVPVGDGSHDMYVGGSFNGSIRRLTSDGSVNTTFAPGTNLNSFVTSILVAPDTTGDVYVGGGFTQYGATARRFIARLKNDGTLQTSFAVGAGFSGTPNALIAVPGTSGDIYAVGSFITYNGAGALRFIRLKDDGTPNNTTTGDFPANVTYGILAPDSTGDLYAVGTFGAVGATARTNFARVHGDGTVVSTFDPGLGPDLAFSALAPSSDGSGDVFVGGTFTTYNGTPANRVARVSSTGTLRSAFGRTTMANGGVTKVAAVEGTSGKIYIGGSFTGYGGNKSANFVARVNFDGSLDTSFALIPNGWTGGSFNTLAPAIDGSGDLYVGGTFTNYNATGTRYLIRFNSDGSVDPAFAIGTNLDGQVNAITPVADGTGDILIGGGFSNYGATPCGGIMRLHPDGTRETALAPAAGFTGGVIVSILPATDTSGDIHVAGNFTAYKGSTLYGYVRLTSTGTISGASGALSNFALPSRIMAAPDSSGDIYIAGSFTGYNGTSTSRLIRVKNDGSLDSHWANTALIINSPIIAATSDGSGDIFAAGNFTTYGGTAASHIVRLHADASLASFVPLANWTFTTFSSFMAAPDGTGDLYLGGNAGSYVGTTTDHLARINPVTGLAD